MEPNHGKNRGILCTNVADPVFIPDLDFSIPDLDSQH
jgi:hypothetical protein